jgi:signal transduction histidine kinase
MNWLNSVKARLALASAAAIATALALAGFGLNQLFNSYIEQRIQQELRGRLLDIAGSFSIDANAKPVLSRPPSDPRYRDPYSGVYWYARERDLVVIRSRSLWDSDITHAAKATTASLMQSGTGPEKQSVYIMERDVFFGEEPNTRTFTLGVALEKSEVQELSQSFGSEIAKGLALLGLVLFAAAIAQLAYGLKPLTSLRRQLANLHQGEQEQLDGPFPAEVEQLATDLNSLFTRQKDMIARARERSGTLAHGLKTPMTVLYGEARRLELSGDNKAADFIREHLNRMQDLVNRELARARAHGTATGLGLSADVTATTERLVNVMQRMPRGSDIVWSIPKTPVLAEMDPDDFGEAMGNLLDNARKWTKTNVWVRADENHGGTITISVEDDGPGVPATFDGDALARGEGNTDSADGSGLGLAIVCDLLERCGSKLHIGHSLNGGTKASWTIKGSIQRA